MATAKHIILAITALKYKFTLPQIIWWIILVCPVFNSSCGNTKNQASSTINDKITAERNEQAFLSFLVDGTQAMLLGDLNKAEDKLYKAYPLQPVNPEILYRIAQLENLKNNQEKSLDFAAKAWDSGWDKQSEYSLFYAGMLKNAGRNADAIEVLKKGISAHSQNTKLHIDLAHVYALSGNTGKAIETLKTIESKKGSTINISTALSEIYYISGDLKSAARHSENGYLMNPQDGTLLLNWFKIPDGTDPEEAKKPINRFISNPPESHLDELYLSAVDLGIKAGLTDLTMQLLYTGLSHPELSNEQKTVLSEKFNEIIQSGILNKSVENLSMLEKLIENNNSSQLEQLAGKMAFDLGIVVKSRQYFQAALEQSDLSYENYLIFLKVLFYQNDWLQIEKTADRALMLYPHSMDLILWKGTSLLALQKIEFKDWYDENYSFMIDASDKANADFLNSLYSGRFNLSENLSFISNKNTALPVFWVVNLTGNYYNITNKEQLFFNNITNIQAGLSEQEQTLWNAFGMLKAGENEKAVELLKKEEKILSENPLFCELYGFALIKLNKKEPGAIWRKKAQESGLVKPLF